MVLLNQGYLEPEPTFFQQNEADFAGYEYLTDYNYSSSFLDPCFEVQDMNYLVNPENILPYFPAPEPLVSETLSFPYEDVSFCPCPKRQRMCQQEFSYPASAPAFAPSFYPMPELQQNTSSQLVSGMVTVENGKNLNEKSVSPQSIAARERRRKITEKTLELSKLIPGGTKMNTADMLQAAYKYVKYMQAQIKFLARDPREAFCGGDVLGSQGA